MLNQDYATKILGLEDVIVTNVENIHDELPEKNTFLPRYHRVTNRLTACIIRSFQCLRRYNHAVFSIRKLQTP